MHLPVLVVTGAGGIGIAACRRLGSGHHILLADYTPAILSAASAALESEGHVVTTQETDVSSTDSVASLISKAKSLATAESSRVAAVVHTAGVPPSTINPNRIWEINLMGAAYMLDACLELASPNMSMIVIASLAGYLIGAPSPALSKHFLLSPTSELRDHPELKTDAAQAHPYGYAKCGNRLRVQAMATKYAAKGARVNSISPGLINTNLARAEMASNDAMKATIDNLIQGSALKRIGSTTDVANMVAFLCSGDAGFITGSDFVVDGGELSSVNIHQASASV
ncbi:Diacetyl reductase [Sphaceloma murrayae]|uniref:Diacetyl reductase n=1 Tax=Sphaceloma murrayae TaxID=2082308 RepID=A0A2K1QP54_9PEZI|nr:Diacetyl reductase [Sphaceloma murrayae]